jgi:hypothetical protein
MRRRVKSQIRSQPVWAAPLRRRGLGAVGGENLRAALRAGGRACCMVRRGVLGMDARRRCVGGTEGG